MASLKERIEETREKIVSAAELAGRDPATVTLVAVSKGQPAWMVKAAHEGGLSIFGENRVQEAETKVASVGQLPVEWHLVGRLQRNKVRSALGLFTVIHSVDSLALMERINRIAAELPKCQRVLIQVDLAGESTKTGVPPAVLPELLRRASDMANVCVEGFMLLPPFFDQAERARPYFRKMADLLREANTLGHYRRPLKDLSMGMTHDYDIAISEGATMVRIGTGVFGERQHAGSPDLA